MEERTIFFFLAGAVLTAYLAPMVYPEAANPSGNPLINGVFLLSQYVSRYFVPALIPAFLIAGALSAFGPKAESIRQLSRKIPGLRTYLWASLAGLVFSVHARTMLPLFAGIRKKGAQVGPSMTFLYTASGTSVLSLVFCAAVIGIDFAIARILLILLFGIVTGFAFKTYFGEDARSRYKGLFEYFEEVRNVTSFRELDKTQTHETGSLLTLIFTLLMIIAVSFLGIDILAKIVFIVALTVVLLIQLWKSYSDDEIILWLDESYDFFRYITPLLLFGLFLIGVLSAYTASGSLTAYFGSINPALNLAAAVVGASAYLPPLLDVAVAAYMIDLGVEKGTVLTYLMASSLLSTVKVMTLNRVLGREKTRTYVFLVILFTTLSGLLYSLI